jgi:hypothetical protein
VQDALAGQPGVRLPCIIRVLGLVLFGDGRCWWVPLLLAGGACAFYLNNLLRLNVSGGRLWYNLAVPAEVAANAYFGYRFCRAGCIAQLVRTVAGPHGVSEGDATRALRWCAWIAAGACAAMIGWVSWLEGSFGAGRHSAGFVATEAAAYTCTFLPMFYLCALWLWTNWLFWRAGRGVVARGITASSVAQQHAGAAVFGLLDEMQAASQVWTGNHAVRAVTTVVMAEAQLQYGGDHPNYQNFSFTLAAVLFLGVLATAAAPGYVSTCFYEEVQRKLAAVAHHSGDGDGSGSSSCGELSAPPSKDTPTALMQRIAAASSGAGMHFAGIPMTVGKAVTVAMAVFYVTRFFAMPACLTPSELPPAPPWWNGTAVVHAQL